MTIPANYTSDGVENLRANPTQRTSPGAVTSPTGGTEAGGTENFRADQKTLQAGVVKVPSTPSGPTPPQAFSGERV